MNTIQVTTAVSQVTVYPDRARVTVLGACQVTAGPLRLVVNELPLALEPESLRVGGKGTARVRLLSANVSHHYYMDTPSANARQLEEEIEQLEEQARALNDEKAIWQAHGKYLDGLRAATAEFAKGLARGRLEIAQQGELLTFLQQEESRLRAATRQLEAQQRALQKQLEKLRQELKALQAARPRQRFQAVVEAEAFSDGEFELALSYVVQQASWRPLYDARLQTEGDAPLLHLTTLAEVQQNTGQDWQNVALTLSTARPALNQRLPELKPWYIQEAQMQPVMRAVKMGAPVPAAPAMQIMDEMQVREAVPAPMMAAAETAVAEIQSGDGETAVSFKVGGLTTIPGHGSPHKTTLNQVQIKPTLDYLAVPKHTDAVFRRAICQNDAPAPLLSGAANLFVADEYIGQTTLPYVPSGGEFKLLLGVEERITVKRELTRREVDKRLLKDNRQLRYGYKLTLKNLLPVPAQTAVHDHIPVSLHEQIKVRLENVQPAPSEKSDLNLLEWRLRLPTNAEQTITYEYVVEHPRTMQVVGLGEIG